MDKRDMRKTTLLLDWFYENKREMPWRKTKDPYCIWVSEVMLQQTQVVTVIPYYLRFIERFPTVSDLAAAKLEEVHRYWQGLGYYRRGENLWKGAKVIQERWGGQFPSDPILIREIPGIGPYTLGAVASIAYGLKLPAVDGNVMRVISRWYMIADDIGIARNRKIFEQKVMENMPEDAGGFNQALMELGALVCTPRGPECDKCPVSKLCQAHIYRREEAFPVKAKKVKVVEERYYVLIIEKDGKTGMIKRSAEGILANLWGMPMISEEAWHDGKWDQLDQICLEPVNHLFTHKKWKMIPVILKWTHGLEKNYLLQNEITGKLQYFTQDEQKQLPVATAFKKVLKRI